MSNKVNIPNPLATAGEGVSHGLMTYLQAVHEAFGVVDNNVVYGDDITVNVQPGRLRASSAQGQGFVVSGAGVASSEDFAILVSEFKVLLEDFNRLNETVATLVNQVKGT